VNSRQPMMARIAGSTTMEDTSMSSTEFLRDTDGNMVAQVSVDDSRYTIRDIYGNLLGWYDEDTRWTRDRYSHPVGGTGANISEVTQRTAIRCRPYAYANPAAPVEKSTSPDSEFAILWTPWLVQCSNTHPQLVCAVALR
jgi:hypothetical protein